MLLLHQLRATHGHVFPTCEGLYPLTQEPESIFPSLNGFRQVFYRSDTQSNSYSVSYWVCWRRGSKFFSSQKTGVDSLGILFAKNSFIGKMLALSKTCEMHDGNWAENLTVTSQIRHLSLPPFASEHEQGRMKDDHYWQAASNHKQNQLSDVTNSKHGGTRDFGPLATWHLFYVNWHIWWGPKCLCGIYEVCCWQTSESSPVKT